MRFALRRVLVGLLMLTCTAAAGEIVESTVVKRDGAYRIDVLARIEAPLSIVHDTITDYDHLTDINSSIVESRIVERQGDNRYRVFTGFDFCVMLFCKQFKQVQDIVELGETQVVATILPESSDFESGGANWSLVSDEDVTYMEFSAEVTPGFWVPPFIGTLLFDREMSKQVLETVEYMEARYAAQSQ